MKDVFVKFSAFRSAAVVAPDLVSSVNSAHVGVVVHDRHGARHRYPRTILLAPEDVSRLELAGGGHDCDNLSIHPRTCTYIAFSVLPKNNSRHDGRAWFGRGLWSHQSFWSLSFSTSKKILFRRLAEPTCLKYAGENTGLSGL